jgi:ribosomal protein S18 acetylase RimI-like enzyme
MQIRKAHQEDAHAIAIVRVDSWKSTYQGLLPIRFLDSLSYRDIERYWSGILVDPEKHGATFVAEMPTGQIVGFALCGKTRDVKLKPEGEIFAIYLLQEYQRQGIGRQLFLACANQLRKSGLRGMAVWALETNQIARGFYERMGGEITLRKPAVFGGMRVTQVAYCWYNLNDLLEQSAPHLLHSEENP